jgi:hypothetical protein
MSRVASRISANICARTGSPTGRRKLATPNHRWRTPSLEHIGRPGLVNISQRAKYGRCGVLCAHQTRCRSNFAARIVARKTTAVGKSHRGPPPESSFRNVRTRRLPTLVHLAFLNLKPTCPMDGPPEAWGDCSGGPGRAGLTTLRGCIHRAKTAVLFQG